MPTGVGTAMLLGGALSAGSSIYGAHKQDQTNQRNLDAQTQARNQLQGLIMPQMSNSPNMFGRNMMDFLSNSAYNYKDPGNGAFTTDPSTIDLSKLQQFAGAQVGAPGAGGMIDLSKLGIDAPGALGAPKIDANIPQSQAFNTGQDALMQMMRANIAPQMDQGLSGALQNQISGKERFDTSGLLDALKPLDQQMIDQQTADLRGSAGSLGQRLGSDMFGQERQMRTDFSNQTAARNAGIQQSSYNDAQSRAMQALGLATGREQSFAQMGLQNTAQQGGMAQMLAQLGLGQSGLSAQIAQQNAANEMNTGQFNAGQQMQARLANQQTNLAGQQSNADILNRIALANQQAQQQAGLANQGAFNNGLSQNASFMNQGNQFNASQRMAQNQFGANQGNIFNQMMMSGMGQAGQLDQQDRNRNAQLLGLLGGQAVPMMQASGMPAAMGDMGSMAMMLPMLMQMMRPQTPSPAFGFSGAPAPVLMNQPFNYNG